MAMSTARAEATLVVLEAERAQLERRLKKVKDKKSGGLWLVLGLLGILRFFWIPINGTVVVILLLLCCITC